jgi:hypothetical protein
VLSLFAPDIFVFEVVCDIKQMRSMFLKGVIRRLPSMRVGDVRDAGGERSGSCCNAREGSIETTLGLLKLKLKGG